MATIGMVGNENHKNRVLGKAGASNWVGFRPKTRGVAMNPIDHPHGTLTKNSLNPNYLRTLTPNLYAQH